MLATVLWPLILLGVNLHIDWRRRIRWARMQRMKGKANEVAGRAQRSAGAGSGSGKTEAKGQGKVIKGKAQQAAGHTKAAVKKAT